MTSVTQPDDALTSPGQRELPLHIPIGSPSSDRKKKADMTPEKAAAEAFLKSLIDKTLRIHTTDSRMFVGTFKCTDPESNVVLSLTHEYRQPSKQQLLEAATAAAGAGEATVKADMTSRYLGLVVIPGEHIAKMEIEEFASQAKSRSIFDRRDIYGGS